MYQVKFKSSGDIFNLIGFNGDKIIIRFNNSQSVGTVSTTGYESVEHNLNWEDIKTHFENSKEDKDSVIL